MDSYLFTPAGSAALAAPEKRPELARAISQLPSAILSTVSSPHTGAYIRGVGKIHKLSEEQNGLLALGVLQVFLGYKTLAELPAALSSELKIANDKAQKIADEIEKELIAPVAQELNQYLTQKKQQKGSVAGKTSDRGSQPQNVLDLKDPKQPPAPPPVPLS